MNGHGTAMYVCKVCMDRNPKVGREGVHGMEKSESFEGKGSRRQQAKRRVARFRE